MFKKTICLLLICFIMLTTACTSQRITPDTELKDPEYTMAKSTFCVYQNNFYYVTDNGFLYYCALEDLKDIEKYEKCLCFDPLCEHSYYDDVLCMGNIPARRMCLRTVDGKTYLYASYMTIDEYNVSSYEIARYDISNAERTVLVKGIEHGLNPFFVTDDLIVFEEACLPHTVIKVYSFADEKCYELPNDDQMTYHLIGYDDGLIYYSDISNNVYSNSPTLDSEEKIFTGVLPYGYYIYNGELYYPHKLKSQKLPGIDWMSFNSIDVYKTPLDSPSKTNSSMVAKDICSFGKTSHFIIDGTFYYLPSEPKYLGIFTESYEGMPDMQHAVVDEHGGTLCSVDLQRLRKTNLVEGLEYNIYELIYASPEYVIFFSNASGNRTDIPFNSDAAIFAYEVQTKECYMIVDY